VVDKELWRIDEAAEYLRVSRGTVYHWIRKKWLKVVKHPGKPLRIVKDSIEDLLTPSHK